MQYNLHINADELNSSFLKSIKDNFKGKDINISIKIEDETNYLLSSNLMRQRLLESMESADELSVKEVYERLSL